MSGIWPVLALIAVWALVRLGRQSGKGVEQRQARRHWRIAASLLGAAMLGGGVLAGSHGAWPVMVGLIGTGLYLIVAARFRAPVSRGRTEDAGDADARSVLGVDAGASPDAIRAAWRRLIGRAHPDQGGTERLAARLNAARDRLLKNRR